MLKRVKSPCVSPVMKIVLAHLPVSCFIITQYALPRQDANVKNLFVKITKRYDGWGHDLDFLQRKSVRRTRSHTTKLCDQEGLGCNPNKQPRSGWHKGYRCALLASIIGTFRLMWQAGPRDNHEAIRLRRLLIGRFPKHSLTQHSCAAAHPWTLV